MAKTARVNTRKVTKVYDKMTANGWDLNFEYEAESGVLNKIAVQGSKEGATVYIGKENNQVQAFFNGSDYDVEVVAAVVTEMKVITGEYSVV
ncbi:MAG TPA: hypothetical protein VF602_09435 [Pedobacter sp.]|jgi:hypothetical protein